MSVTAAELPVRKYGENQRATYYKVNGAWNVVRTVHGDRLCCIDCRSTECIHVRAASRFIANEALGALGE